MSDFYLKSKLSEKDSQFGKVYDES